MDIVLLFVLLTVSWGGWTLRKEPIEEYISPSQTSAINGIFVMFVFLRHFKQYIELGRYDAYFKACDSWLGQLIVTTFLFYSGYGIMYSIMHKDNYVRTIPKRALKLLIRFDVAIILFLIVGLIIGKHYPLQRILLSFTGWKSVGNSNWYIFVVLCLYVFTFVAGIILKNKYLLIALFVAACGLGYIFVVSLLGKGTYWYDTILCYPAGMLFAVNADKINSILKKSMAGRVLSIIFTFVLFILCYNLRSNISDPYAKVLMYELTAIFFVLFIVALTTVFVVSNAVLVWLGRFVFEIYILQRIPMILLKDKIPGTGLYFALCFAITLVISVIFKKTEEIYAVHKS